MQDSRLHVVMHDDLLFGMLLNLKADSSQQYVTLALFNHNKGSNHLHEMRMTPFQWLQNVRLVFFSS